MGSVDVVAEAVRVMTGFAGGAAGAVGAEVGQTVSDLVRQRIGGSPSGRAVLDVVEERPQDPEALAALREAVRERVAADPEFAARLAEALAGPPPAGPPTAGPPAADPPPAEPPREYTGSIVIDGGAKVRGSTLSLGPVTFNNTPAGRTALVASLAVLLVLVVFAVYGGTQAFSGEDSPGSDRASVPGARSQSDGAATGGGSDAGPGTGTGAGTGVDGTDGADKAGGAEKPVPLADADAVLSVLPDTTSLTSGWTQSSPPTADVASQDDGSTFEGSAVYYPSYGMDTQFLVFAYPSEKKAKAAFTEKSREAAGEGAQRLSMPAIGDELIAFSQAESQGDGYVSKTTDYTLVRTGTVLTVVGGKDTESRSYGSDDLQFATQLMSDRARAAQAR
ncbi:hypothetical protein AB0N81_03625 [Streptomyces sp. NPDC093510]|uniref:hypothetical protein n=1 Tax=Streptomyces sp. NPDC093510 TaxID=3155199 RepID=UPI00343D7EF5